MHHFNALSIKSKTCPSRHLTIPVCSTHTSCLLSHSHLHFNSCCVLLFHLTLSLTLALTCPSFLSSSWPLIVVRRNISPHALSSLLAISRYPRNNETLKSLPLQKGQRLTTIAVVVFAAAAASPSPSASAVLPGTLDFDCQARPSPKTGPGLTGTRRSHHLICLSHTHFSLVLLLLLVPCNSLPPSRYLILCLVLTNATSS